MTAGNTDTPAGVEALEPCPFCGGLAYSKTQNSYTRLPSGDWTQHVWCIGCGIVGPERDTAAEAIAAWNTRTLSTAELEADKARLVEALQSAAATLLAVRATSADLDEWKGSADHFHNLCGTEVRNINGALSTLSTGGNNG